MKKSGRFGVFKLLCLCLIVAIVSAFPTLAIIKNRSEGLEKNLNGDISNFQGVLTIWNVDTFESGSQSKTVFLEEVSRQFSLKNKGLYFIIKNLSVDEMTENFMNGVFPDVITFGHGIGEMVKPILETLNTNSVESIRSDVLTSGTINGELKAVGFLMGGYILASTEEKLATAGIETNQKLSDVLNSAGYDVETKKSVKHVASVVYGENVFIRPEIMSEVAFGLALEDKSVSPTMYDAYVDFVGYDKGTILVGTQRDLYKLSGRVKVGKISGIKIEYVNSYTNLIQYAGVVNNQDSARVELSKKFIEFLATVEAQSMTSKIGMINVIGQKFYEEGEFKDMEEQLSGKLIIPNLFNN